MKKLAIAFACIAMAFATMSCSKAYNDPDQIDLTKYDMNDDLSCWALTCKSGSASATEYTWTNEYFIAAGVKGALEMLEGTGVSYSWYAVSAANEDDCIAKNSL